MKLKASEQNNFDLLRLGACVFIFLYHLLILFHQNIQELPKPFFEKVVPHFGHYALLVFFVISGYLVTKSAINSASAKEFIVKRVARIYPAYIFQTLILAFIVGVFFTTLPILKYFTNIKFFKFLVTNILLITNERILPDVFNERCINNSVWSLFLEIKLYFFTAITVLLFKFHRQKKYYLFCFIALTIYHLFISVDDISAFLKIDYSILYDYAYYYFAGSILYIYKEKVPTKLLLTVLAIALIMFHQYLPFQNIVFKTIGEIYLVYYLALGLPFSVKINTDISYGIFIWHAPVIIIFIHIFPLYNNVFLFFLFTILATSAMAIISWFFVEKRVKSHILRE